MVTTEISRHSRAHPVIKEFFGLPLEIKQRILVNEIFTDIGQICDTMIIYNAIKDNLIPCVDNKDGDPLNLYIYVLEEHNNNPIGKALSILIPDARVTSINPDAKDSIIKFRNKNYHEALFKLGFYSTSISKDLILVDLKNETNKFRKCINTTGSQSSKHLISLMDDSLEDCSYDPGIAMLTKIDNNLSGKDALRIWFHEDYNSSD